MSKPYYEIDEEIKNIILELTKKCKELDLGNLSFQYYNVPNIGRELTFYIREFKTYWELVVAFQMKEGLIYYNYRDIYKIYDNETYPLMYMESEKEMD